MAYDLRSAQIYLPKNKVIWDNTYKNVIRFTTDEKISQLLDLQLFYENYNFVFNNFLKPNAITLSIDDNSEFNAIEMANLKMIVVKAFFVSETRFFYYFVDSVVQTNGNTWRYSLSLDVLSTFKINKDFRIEGIFTERLHFDRYQKTSSGNIICSANIYDLQTANEIDFDVDSSDYIYNSKISQKIAKNIKYYSLDELPERPELEDVPEQAIPQGWILVYVQDKNSKYKCRLHSTSYEEAIQYEKVFENANALLLPYIIYAVPLTKRTTEVVLTRTDTGVEYREISLEKLLTSLESRTDKILDIKLVSYLPIDIDIHVSENGYTNYIYIKEIDLNNENTSTEEKFFPYTYAREGSTTLAEGGFVLFNIYKDKCFAEENIDLYEMLNESGIFQIPNAATKSAFRKIKYEIQMLKKPYFNITIKSPYSEGYEFSFFDVINSNVDLTGTFRRESVPVVETSKEMNYFINNREGTGLFKNVEYKVGDISNPIYNLTWEYDSLAEYLQNNKNALMTSALTPFVSAGVGAVSAFAATKNPVMTAFTSAAGLIGGLVNSAITIDNIKNKPNSIKVGTNALLNDLMTYETLHPKIYLKALREDKRAIVFDWIYRYGYSWNRASNSIDWFNRYIFNYVKTMDSVHAHIKGLAADTFINESIENEISRILNNGVTFWEEDSGHIYNWNYENFEKAILED